MKLRLEKIDKLIDKGFVLKTSLKGFFPIVKTPECKKVNIFSENFENLSLPGFSWIAFIFPFAVAAQIRNWSFFWFVAILSFLCELFIAISSEMKNTVSVFMTAAVSDFILNKADGKISRHNGKLNLELIPNKDIIASIKTEFPDVKCIAFSAQVDDDLNFDKLKSKNVDYLVINNILNNEFGSDENKISIINRDELIYKSNTLSKDEIAQAILINLDY